MAWTPSEAGSPLARREHLNTILERGLESCRRGRWKEGLVDLAWVAESGEKKDLPGLCYSYLGYGLARYNGKLKNGLRLCRHAVNIEFYQPENYLNLARTCLLSPKYRRDAFEAVRDGLKVDSDHPELLRLHHELGMRRAPVLPFLSRDNVLNRILGSIRHQFAPQPEEPEAEEGEETQADTNAPITTIA